MLSQQEFRHFRYFAGVPEAQLNAVASISSIRSFKAGERLAEEGSAATHLMIVKSGQVDIVYRLGDGREVAAESAVSGDVVSWSALLAPHTLTASIVGTHDGELIVIEGMGLLQLCDNHCLMGYQLMTEVAVGLRDRLTGLRVQIAAGR